MAWAGTATVWGMVGGIPTSFPVSRLPFLTDAQRKSIFFVQISDSHIGFNKEANKDVTATLQEAVSKVNALPQSPALVLHTGDITQLAKAEEFDTANEVLKGLKTNRVFYVPGEHDVATDNGAAYLQRYGKGTKGGGWYSFDHSGVHFIGLVNVLNLKAGGLGSLGADQIAWLKKDVAGLPSSTPIVLFAHVPLWTVYPEWGWGTDDSRASVGSSQALRIGHGVERPHSPDHAEGRRQRVVSHGDVDGVSAADAWHCAVARSNEGRAGAAQECPRHHERHVHSGTQRAGRRRRHALRRAAGVRGRSHDAMMQRQTSRKNLTLAAERDRHRQLRVHAVAVDGQRRDDGDVDQQRRRAAPHREHAEQVQAVRRPRHRPAVQRDTHEAGHVRLFLLAASEDAGQDRSAVMSVALLHYERRGLAGGESPSFPS